MIKHDTASLFVFHHDAALGWRVGLIKHPLFGVWMQPGGHVEDDETPYEAAVREAREETGLAQVRFVEVHTPPTVAATATAVPMPLPVWIIEHPVPKGDNHVREAHVHIDHKFLAVADSEVPATTPEQPFEWFGREQVAELDTFGDVRAVSAALFDIVAARTPTP